MSLEEEKRYQRIEDEKLMREILLDEFSFDHIRLGHKYTHAEWKRFDLLTAQEMCEKYNIILIDYQTPGDRAKKILKKFNIKNLNKGINTMNKYIDEFNVMMGPGTKSKSMDLNIWGESKPRRKRKSKKKAKTVEKDYSFLYL